MDACESVTNENNLAMAATSLLIFDDMVLTKIMKKLTIVDLANLGETCKRLERLTQRHFGKYHTNVSWVSYRHPLGNTVRPAECERIFGHIGKHIKSMKLSLWADFEFYEILVIIATHCRQMDCLILESIRLSRPLTLCDPLISTMFAKLKRFVLNGCFWMGWCPLDIFFGLNSTLKDLSVINCCAITDYGYRLELGGFESLKLLRLVRCRNVISEAELEACFRNNKIKYLIINDIGNVNLFLENVIDSICDTVIDLTIDFFNDMNVDQLLRLKKLKALRIHCRVCSDVDDLLIKLSSDNIIEELVITRISVSNKTIEALQNFRKLTRLRFDHSTNTVPRQFFRSLPTILPQLEQFVYAFSSIRDEDIVFMFKYMPNLNRLSLYGCNELATKTYIEIIEILTNDWQRPKLELIPPKVVTSNSLQAIKRAKSNIWLRTDIVNKHPKLS